MNFFTTQDNAKLFYKDIGEGFPVILIHGWPLNADMWEEQSLALLNAGFRVIAYDRRGFGRSEQTASGYDYDTFASDLNDLVLHLGLDKFSLVGFSMGGGEVARYLSTYGSEKVSSASLISAVTPYLLETDDNPNGVPEDKFQEMEEAIRRDRFGFFHGFFRDFYGVGLMSHPVSDPVLAWAEQVASQASLKATIECVNAFGRTDFRKDMNAFDIPTLIIHGTEDITVPIEASAEIAAEMIPGAIFKRYEDAAHGLNISYKKELNNDLVEFLTTHSQEIYTSVPRSASYQSAESLTTQRPH